MLGLLAPTTAWALTFQLDVELDDALHGAFGTVEVTEAGRGLFFTITLGSELGSGADLHEFYFNLAGEPTDLTLSSDDSVNTPYALSSAHAIAGGAGSRFDWEVNFGNGASQHGNGVLQQASFLIEPDDESLSITLANLFGAERSSASGGRIELDFAAHVQGTSLVEGANSETVGGIVPEPTTGIMLAAGLALAGCTQRRQRRG
jgi:hypothetical protein